LLALHGTLLAAAVTGFYKYSDRSDHFEKSLKGLSDTLETLKRQIAVGLADRLRPVFEHPRSVTLVLLDASGAPFQERYVSPDGSETYREALFAFALSHFSALVDLKNLVGIREKWLFWARVLGWTFLLVLISEALLAACFFLSLKLLALQVSSRLAAASLIPAATGFVSFVIAAVRISFLHDHFVELRKRYASP
jgi:hypothetical protein